MVQDSAIVEGRSLIRTAADGRSLLDGVSLQVYPGDRIAIVGSSGSGKTVLLRALSVLDEVDSGEILFQGRPIAGSGITAYRAQVQYLQQRPVLFEGTVEDNLRRPFSLRVHSERTYRRDPVLNWLQELGRGEEFLSKRHENLSGGELQITALLRAMQLEPDVLLLDEPTAALDAEAARACESLLQAWLSGTRRTAAWVWVTHSADQAARMGDRICRMADGHLTSAEV